MALNLEICGPNNKWIKIGNINPKDQPGSVSNNKIDGSREIYIFECSPDNSKSTIYRSITGLDTEIGKDRLVTTVSAEVVKELRKGDIYEMKIKTDKNRESRLIRFTHL